MRLLLALIVPALAMGQSPPGSLTLQQALQIALDHRAESKAAEYQVAAREADVRQASRAPNPTLFIQSENWRGGSDFSPGNDVDAFVYVSQQIETAGKRKHRTLAAEAERDIAKAEALDLRWRIEGAVTEAWWPAYQLQREARLMLDAVASTQEFLEYEESRWREGASAGIDVIKVRVEAGKAKRRLLESRVAEAAALNELAVELGIEVADDTELRTVTAVPATDVPLDRVLAERPDLQLALAELRRDDAVVLVEQSLHNPNVTPYFGYKRTGGLNTLIGGVSLPLPINNRNGGAIARATAETQRQRQTVRAMEMRVAAEFRRALQERQGRREMLGELSELVSDAETAHGALLAAYREGGVSLLSVLDARRSLQDARLLLLQAEVDEARSRTAVVRVSGMSLLSADLTGDQK